MKVFNLTLTLLIVLVVFNAIHPRSVTAQAAVPIRQLSGSVRLAPALPAGVIATQEGVVVEVSGESVSAADAASDPAAALQASRLSKIQSLTFDRRPSAILNAWAGIDQRREAARLADEAEAAEKAAAENAAEAAANAESTGLTETPSDSSPVDESTAASEANAQALEAFDLELNQVSRQVTLSQWNEVATYLRDRLNETERKALYQRLLESIAISPDGLPLNVSPEVRAQLQQLRQLQGQQQQIIPEAQQLDWSDLEAIITLAPDELDETQLAMLGGLISIVKSQGQVLEALITRFDRLVSGEAPPVAPRVAAKIMMAAGELIVAGRYLPTLDQALSTGDWEGLNLLAVHYLAVEAKESDDVSLEAAWNATQAVIVASEQVDSAQRDAALTQAVALAPKVRERLGDAWLEQSFSGDGSRGREILATIGAAVAKGTETHATDATTRLAIIELQSTAVAALLKSTPAEQLPAWRETLRTLALNWLREAELSHRFAVETSLTPQMQFDSYGNLYYASQMNQMSRSIAGISVAEVLEQKPSDEWMAQLDPEILPPFRAVTAKLYLKVGEEERALPDIEAMAQFSPQLTQELVDEFLRVWTENHDPNSARRRGNSFIYFYGFEQRAEAIPLTRSKQQRNLIALRDLVARLRQLPVELDQELLANAFTTCHSSAEVYRLEAIEEVFGGLESIDPETMAALAQGMRANLAGLWRLPATQEEAKTKRRQRDIQAEVLRGYEVARAVLQSANERHPDSWELQLALASLTHDEQDYRRELAPSTDFVAGTQVAFDQYARAAEHYATFAASASTKDFDTMVFEQWLAAAMGAVDLERIDDTKVPVMSQVPKIREALDQLPGTVKDQHIELIATQLFPRMSSLAPVAKYRYLRAAFELIGEHPQARQARDLLDYYDDLVSELQLVTRIDGSTTIGHGKPFGVFVELRHTNEIERESGGFSKYLQNQNSANQFYYNYGRPLEDYRDKFEEGVRQALADRFDVLGVTFESEDVHSLATEQPGWRTTPYAYLLLKARGPEIDSIPALKLDFDFLDTSGYVVLPVESSIVPVDASTEPTSPRPYENLVVTQTLDERQASEGKLILEVQATCEGLPPDLEQLFNVEVPGFEVSSIDDPGPSVSRFSPESETVAVEGTRQWNVSLTAATTDAQIPKSFEFLVPQVETSKTEYQRFEDADLVSVPASIDLRAEYGRPSRAWIGWLAGVCVAIAITLGVVWWLKQPAQEVAKSSSWKVPSHVDPFVAIEFLRRIERDGGLADSARDELRGTIRKVEVAYFSADATDPEFDLKSNLERWAAMCRA